ncbi:hypothetical protein TRFO_27091 [Tritrichomonas foetus]|uniref:Clathrin adaptor alpha/beta/gamma-adaptin appendage Ig-like subdomain domain-containing protein n=1 Tax=Tritrichomonas foetus TaxID=1144522 RepID=A0A1J4K325_9EUKA|nr:hypothetical protein TRFO_27091 [Tritrichomonas foetus]|eukprot:OHT05224.1 hypothetical protein TRFO_27091 [Tritrichomonas foetus]
MAGDECHDGVWHRVVQVISMNSQYQRYATLTSFNSMTSSTAHDRLIKLAAQLVGEYAHLIPIQPMEIIDELKKKFVSASEDAKSIILSALAKIGARFEAVRGTVLEFIVPLRNNQNIDIQQRAIEFASILQAAPNVIAAVFKPIPPFKERKSSLVQQVLSETRATAPVINDNEEEEEDQNEGAMATSLPVRVPEVEQPAPQQQMQQPPMQQQPVQDDLLGGMVGPSVPQQQPIQQQPQQVLTGNTLDDLMAPSPAQQQGGDDLLSAFGGGNAGIPAVANSPEMVFKRFLTEDNGVVFEDACVALNLQIQTNGPNAFLNFTIQNKMQTPVTNVKLNLLPVPFFRTTPRPGPPVIQPGQLAAYQYALTVLAPYSTPPNFTFGYSSASSGDYRETMKLPLVISKFMMNYPMDQNMFFARWGQFSAPNQTAKISYPVQQGQDVMQQMTQVLNKLLRIPVLPLQLPPLNIVGAGIIQCEGNPQGVLARFFADESTGQVQIEIKGTSPHITGAIQHILDSNFK